MGMDDVGLASSGVFALFLLTSLVLGFLLAVYVGDELRRREHTPDDKYMKLFSEQSIGLKLGLLAITFTLWVHNTDEASPVHVLILALILIGAMHRLYGRTQLRKWARRRDRRREDNHK